MKVKVFGALRAFVGDGEFVALCAGEGEELLFALSWRTSVA